jgi:hypothetical protein
MLSFITLIDLVEKKKPMELNVLKRLQRGKFNERTK